MEKSAEGKLYDLFLMGLAWLRQDNPDVLMRPGMSVFSSLQHAASTFGPCQSLAMQSWDLMELVRDHSVVREGDKHPKKRDLRALIATSTMHNVVLATPASGMAPQLFFGPNGYSHVITDAGLAYADSVVEQYTETLTKDMFLQGWGTYRRRMAILNAKERAEADAAKSDAG